MYPARLAGVVAAATARRVQSGRARARDLRVVAVALCAAVAVLLLGAVFGFVPVQSRSFSLSIPYRLACDGCVSSVVVRTVGSPTSTRITGTWSTGAASARVELEVQAGTGSDPACIRCDVGYSSPANATEGSFAITRPLGDPGPFLIIVFAAQPGNATAFVSGSVYSVVV